MCETTYEYVAIDVHYGLTSEFRLSIAELIAND